MLKDSQTTNKKAAEELYFALGFGDCEQGVYKLRKIEDALQAAEARGANESYWKARWEETCDRA